MMKGGLFRKKKNSEGFGGSAQNESPNPNIVSKLQELSGNNTALYTALARLLFLDPKKISAPLETHLTEAQDYETKGEKLRAELAYRIAGAIALYKGDADAVQRYFTKALALANSSRPEYKMLTEHSSDAVAIAKRYYESEQST